jgi:hypothetical protein
MKLEFPIQNITALCTKFMLGVDAIITMRTRIKQSSATTDTKPLTYFIFRTTTVAREFLLHNYAYFYINLSQAIRLK